MLNRVPIVCARGGSGQAHSSVEGALTSPVGLVLLEARSASEHAVIADFAHFAGAASASVGVFRFIFSSPAAALKVAVNYVLDLRRPARAPCVRAGCWSLRGTMRGAMKRRRCHTRR